MMGPWLLAGLLLLAEVGANFRGLPKLSAFSKDAHARLLVYFNNENEFALIAQGEPVQLALDTHLWIRESCCAHRATPSLSHDGNRIAFVHLASAQPRQEAIGILDVATGATADVFKAPAIWGISWSPDDDRLATVADADEPGHNVYLIDLAAKSTRQLTHGKLDLAGATYIVSDHAPPSWSPDGEEIAMELQQLGAGTRSGSHSVVAVWELGSNQVRKLADGVEPSWSPAGDYISFFGPERMNCFAIRPDGSDRKLLFSASKGFLSGGRSPMFFPVVWSPDGKRVLWHEWVDADLQTEIYELDLATGRSKRVGKSELQVVNWR
jgi:Tol biopolymer transport system component